MLSRVEARRSTRLVASVFAAGLLIAACGDDGNSGPIPQTGERGSTTETTAPPADETVDAATDETAAADTETDDTGPEDTQMGAVQGGDDRARGADATTPHTIDVQR